MSNKSKIEICANSVESAVKDVYKRQPLFKNKLFIPYN